MPEQNPMPAAATSLIRKEQKILSSPEGAYLLPDQARAMNDLRAAAGALSTSHVPEIILYIDRDWSGAEWRTNFGWGYVGDNWNDKISAIVVVSGNWRFYEHRDKGGQPWDLGPGYYAFLPDHGIPHDTISSFEAISW